jgi:hypothetical protein
MFQIETGFTLQKNEAHSKSSSLPSILWKYGVNENFELRLITENKEKKNGFTPIHVGFKVKLSNEKGIVPKTSFIGHISLPNIASPNYKTTFVASEFRFAIQHSLSEKISFSYNLGAEWDGFSAEPTFIYSVATGYSISKK